MNVSFKSCSPPDQAASKSQEYCILTMLALRLHPVVPGNARYAIRDTILPVGGGPDESAPLFVPKGTLVAYNPYAMHRRKDLFGPDADVFRPERWETLRPGWEYLVCARGISPDLQNYTNFVLALQWRAPHLSWPT